MFTTYNRKLAISIVYKSTLMALGVNKLFMDEGEPINFNDEREYPLFKNLCGIPHQFNNRLFYTTISGESKEITLDILNTDDVLRAKLYMGSVLYKYLVETYPDDYTYIKGLCIRMDMDTLLSLDEGTVIGYDKSLVGWNEVSLIKDIGKRIQSFLLTNSNPDFININSMYAPSLALALYNDILHNVSKIRLANRNTYQACETLQDIRLDSNFGISNLTKHITRESKLWLYMNINHIAYNIGKDDNLLLVIEKLIVPSGVRVSKVSSKVTKPNLIGFINTKDKQPLGLYDKLDGSYKGDMSFQELTRLTNKKNGVVVDDVKDFYYKEKRLKSLALLPEDTKFLVLDYDGANGVSLENRFGTMISLLLLKLSGEGDVNYSIMLDGVEFYPTTKDVLAYVIHTIMFLKDESLVEDVYEEIELPYLYTQQSNYSSNTDNLVLVKPDGSDIIGDKTYAVYSNSLVPYAAYTRTYKDLFEQQQNVHKMDYKYSLHINNAYYKSMYDLFSLRLQKKYTTHLSFTLPLREEKENSKLVTVEPSMERVISIIEQLFGAKVSLAQEGEEILSNNSKLMELLSSYTVNVVSKEVEDNGYNRYMPVNCLYDTGIINIEDVDYNCGDRVNVSVDANDTKMSIGVARTSFVSSSIKNRDCVFIVDTSDNGINYQDKINVAIKVD